MPLENRSLEAGTRLAARYKGQQRTCEVVQADDGLRYRLDDGREFTSPSSAGKAAMDGVACNGWRFWSIEGELKEKREPKAKGAPTAKTAKPATKKPAKPKSAKRGSKAKAKKPAKVHNAKSGASYGCGACGADFPTQKAAVEHALSHTS